MKIKMYDQLGKDLGQVELPAEIFGLELNEDLVHQAVVAQMANCRQVIAHTKDRSEVRGGGRKPWQQKGTGRARHGSIRSPIWIGGGVTFGPTKDRNYSKKINKKMKRKALFMALSSKAKDNELILVDKFSLAEAKTKNFLEVVAKLGTALDKDLKKSTMLVLSSPDEKIIRASKNVSKIKILSAKSLNIVDVLRYKHLIIPKEAIKVIGEHYKI